MFRYCSAFQGEGRVTARQLEQGGGGLRATGSLNDSLEGVGTLGGLRSVWVSCFKSFCATCSLRGGPQESPPPQGPTADWRRHSRPKPRQPDSFCRTSGMADTGLLVSHYWPQIQDSMQLGAGMVIFTMCSGRQGKLECRERQLKQCHGEKSRDEKPGSPRKKRGGGERIAVYIPKGVSGLCFDPHEAQLPFRPWPMSSPLSILAQASLSCICYVKPKEPWLSKWAGTETGAKPGILVAQAGSTRGCPCGGGVVPSQWPAKIRHAYK